MAYTGTWAGEAGDQGVWRLDYSGRRGEATAPTLVLCGRRDPQYLPACSGQLAAHIGAARLVFLQRSGYFPCLMERAAFWEIVGTFLQRPVACSGGGQMPRGDMRPWGRAPFAGGWRGDRG